VHDTAPRQEDNRLYCVLNQRVLHGISALPCHGDRACRLAGKPPQEIVLRSHRREERERRSIIGSTCRSKQGIWDVGRVCRQHLHAAAFTHSLPCMNLSSYWVKRHVPQVECANPFVNRGKPMKVFDRFEFMQLFVRIAETRSLSTAAQSLGISQPSASRQLKQLESLIGVQLVRRSTHDLALTDAGSRFLEDARAMLADWETSIDTLRKEREELRGSIKVAVPIAVGQTNLATIAARFLIRHPAVKIDWRVTDQPGDLTAGGYDLWIRAGPIRQLDLVVRPLWRVERTVVAASSFRRVSHPKALERLASVVVFTFVRDEILLTGPSNHEAVLKLSAAFSTDNIYAAIEAVREGVGYGILPFWAIKDDLDSGRLIELCPEWHPPFVMLSVAYPPSRYRPVRINAFVDYLRTEIPKTGAGILAVG
jgi:DNA-binding transcriptional LysR family regulator